MLYILYNVMLYYILYNINIYLMTNYVFYIIIFLIIYIIYLLYILYTKKIKSIEKFNNFNSLISNIKNYNVTYNNAKDNIYYTYPYNSDKLLIDSSFILSNSIIWTYREINANFDKILYYIFNNITKYYNNERLISNKISVDYRNKDKYIISDYNALDKKCKNVITQIMKLLNKFINVSPDIVGFTENNIYHRYIDDKNIYIIISIYKKYVFNADITESIEIDKNINEKYSYNFENEVFIHVNNVTMEDFHIVNIKYLYVDDVVELPYIYEYDTKYNINENSIHQIPTNIQARNEYIKYINNKKQYNSINYEKCDDKKSYNQQRLQRVASRSDCVLARGKYKKPLIYDKYNVNNINNVNKENIIKSHKKW